MRSRLALTLTLAQALLAFTCAPVFADKRVALVIGNSAYRHAARLPNPANDAPAVADMFRRARFEVVETKRDLGNAEMRRALRDFADRSSSADIAVIYYAGHGVEVDGMNYLLPVDAILDRDRDAYDEAIPLERVLQAVDSAKELRLVILDACRDNPFANTMKRTVASRGLMRGLAGVEPIQPNTLIAFAAKAGSTALDGTGDNSPFTAALLKHLTAPGMDLRKAFGRVRDEVMQATNNEQEPFLFGSLGGADVALVPVHPTTQAQPQGAPVDVRRDYELAIQVGTRRALSVFLQVHPNGYYADLARAQLDKIAAEDTRRNPGETAAPEPPRQAAAAAAPAGAKPQLAALPANSARSLLPPLEVSRSLQTELRRVGCQTGSVTDAWTPVSRQALELFNKHAGMKLDASLASVDAIDAVKAKRIRVCPLVCAQGFRAQGERCEKVVAARNARRGRGGRDDDDDFPHLDAVGVNAGGCPPGLASRMAAGIPGVPGTRRRECVPR
jgi:hypothetical protein